MANRRLKRWWGDAFVPKSGTDVAVTFVPLQAKELVTGGGIRAGARREHHGYDKKDFTMLSRRSVLSAAAAVAASVALAGPGFATETKTFDPASFAAAQKAGKSIFVAVHASWCPTCKAQKPILSELMADPKFKDLIYFVVDFDGQEDAVKFFDVRMQSTLIAFKGATETGRSVGDTDRESIAALLDKTL